MRETSSELRELPKEIETEWPEKWAEVMVKCSGSQGKRVFKKNRIQYSSIQSCRETRQAKL